MAKDPAFLFYPGDYLRDTQCLSEKSQVAYDRIMCEHMRNICITQDKLNFFTKKLNDDEKNELLHVLSKCEGGYQIEWVTDSIVKRQSYSESRRNNRVKKEGKKDKNICKSYDLHMENEIIYNNTLTNNTLIIEMIKIFKKNNPDIQIEPKVHYAPCLQIAYRIAKMKGWGEKEVLNGKMQETLTSWGKIMDFAADDEWLSSRSLMDLNTTKEWDRLVMKMSKPKKEKPKEKIEKLQDGYETAKKYS